MLPGATVGEVVESKYSSLLAGDVVHAYSGWTDYYVANGSTVQKCDVDLGVPLVKHLGVLGMTGLVLPVHHFGLSLLGVITCRSPI
jgi:NADPH-dependent curcumin reductase CurA